VNRHAPTVVERQRAQLDRLLKDPAKPAYIPSAPKEKSIRPAREMMKNVQGSSAGAGSGEFHVYKASRRREYERLRLLDETAQKVCYGHYLLVAWFKTESFFRKQIRPSLSGRERRLISRQMQRLRRIGRKDRKRRIGRKGREQLGRMGRMSEGQRAAEEHWMHLLRSEGWLVGRN
jgi:hypothetical protein